MNKVEIKNLTLKREKNCGNGKKYFIASDALSYKTPASLTHASTTGATGMCLCHLP